MNFYSTFSPSEISVLFIPFFGARQIVRYHFQLSDPVYTIWDIKERVMQHVKGEPEQVKTKNNIFTVLKHT